MIKAYTINIEGQVQGVGFRFYTNQKANELNIKGFVQNRPDGSVYIEAEGEETNLLNFIHWCHTGPPWAKVKQVNISELPPVDYEEFRVK